MAELLPIKILDAHAGGAPTRLVLAGGPDLGAGPLADRVKVFQARHDAYRRAIVGEPRGSQALVGALLVEPHDKSCQFGVIFFNHAGLLGLCGQGIIGTVVALAHLGRIQPGPVKLDTPAGPVSAQLGAGGEVTFESVPAYRREKELPLYLPGVGDVNVDLAFGGNWFCVIEQHDQRLALDNLQQLTDYCARIRQAVSDSGFPEVDHVALFGPGTQPGVNSRNFVLGPGSAYDRSPSGTGTSARLACLAADGQVAAGTEWVQEGILGSVIRAKYRKQGDKIIPSITGTAYVIGEGTLLVDPADPFAWGMA
ncbi:4-hydroxyproline epimerase [Lacunisphaera limnophila]|uniref:4-hydroxyproline epimerase n=1 Tax=Lacunisphaera limnophila TaxID=1838286 RepID=A0A1D8AX36_9BACT|nr:proline racemase family protein [Lacunisphaera limnophila]AOS45427.1 4-hydroxyproline epimerase [Lacunisphaera limnophila]